MNVTNALLIQTAFIGDVVLTTPMIACFKRFFPEAKLSVLVKPEAAAILRRNPHVDALLILDKAGEHRGIAGMRSAMRMIRQANFDVVLSPHRSHRTSLLVARSGAPLRVGYLEAGFSKLAYNRRLPRKQGQAEIVRLLDFLAEALEIPGARQFSTELEVHVDEAAQRGARELLRRLDLKTPALIAPSSVWETKRWTPWGFAHLIRLIVERLRKPVLLVGSKQDRAIAELCIDQLRLSHPDWIGRKVFNVCGETSLPELSALMRESAFLVSNDSAPVHFGCAARIPTLAIFGPTTPALGYAPLREHSGVVELAGLACRPCGTHGARRCPQRHFRCMKDLDAETVFTRLQAVLR
ncbi:MAG: glycosyltransferase family 9 protein [Leptospirales bacterium]|nr:glycosyltransferase family 9 protein [Leptospirales bacterium]